MRRLRRIVIVLAIGIAATVGLAAPADAHRPGDPSWPYGSTRDICTYIGRSKGYPFPDWYVDLSDSGVRHFNGAHIVTCGIRLAGTSSAAKTVCYHYVIETGSLSAFTAVPRGACYV